MIRALLIFYGAGSIAAGLETLVGWSAAHSGPFSSFATALAYEIPHGLYGRMVWGGLWALAAPLLSLPKLGWLQASLLLSLFPTVAQLLYFFPQSGGGFFGLNHGWATPLAVGARNIFWALVTTGIGNRAGR